MSLSKDADDSLLECNRRNFENKPMDEFTDGLIKLKENILPEKNEENITSNLKIDECDHDPEPSTNIDGWSPAEILSYFKLRTAQLEILKLSQSQINFSVIGSEKEHGVIHEDTRNLANLLSPSRSPSASELQSQRCCAECGRWMANCTSDWLEDLGPDSVWCSMTCIEGRVEKARMVINDSTATISLMRADGHVLPSGPVLSHLASFLRQCPDFVPILPTKQPETKVSVSGTESSRASKVLSKDSDQIRLNVRRALSDALLTRFWSFRVKRAGSVFRMKDCKEVSERLEMELFRVCKQNASLPRYKMWCKHFLTQVKEIRNKGFFYRILSGQLSVQKAASLEPELLGSAEYAVPPSEGSKNISNDTVPSDSPSTIRASVETTEEDQVGTTNSECTGEKSGTKVYKRIVTTAKPSTSAAATGSTLDAILGDGKSDTTAQHLSHFYDANCSICLAKQKTMAEQERREREEKERARVQEKKRRESRKIFGVEREGDANIPERFGHCNDFSVRDSMGIEQMNTVKDSPKSTCAAYDSDGDYGGVGDSPVFTDSWKSTVHREEDWRNERPERSESWRDGMGRPGSSQTALSKFDPNPWDSCGGKKHIRSLTVWHGQVSMGQMTIVSSLSVLSNPVAFQLSTDLPTSLKIKGRIQPIIVFDYLSSLRKAGMKDLPLVDMEGERRFLSLFDDMLSKDRYLVFDVPDDSNIKDGYLLPLPARQEAPGFTTICCMNYFFFLMNIFIVAVLLPFDGPGIGLRHPDMVVCVMVRHRSKEWSRQIVSPAHISDVQKEDISVSPSRANSQNSQNKDSPRTDIASRGSDEVPWSGVSSNTNIPNDYKSMKSNGKYNLKRFRFFEMLRKDKDSATSSDLISSVVPNQDEIETLPDLLLFIQLTSNPKEIKEVVARFMRNPTLTEKDRDVIRKKVMEKIQSEKRRKAENKKLAITTLLKDPIE
uniref:TFIIS central domain-containing protein n=1 Tax=Heterorhabditis bacteriophora TaxID=37862 RepID=A0A1I7XUZ8_HETBA